MRLLTVNLMLAFIWAFATGAMTELNVAIGFVMGMIVLHLVGAAVGDRKYVERFIRIVGLLIIFVRELVVSSFRVAFAVLKPTLDFRPSVIMVPLDLTEDAHITLLANMISLTPGTLTIDVAEDKSCLYVHAMYGGDPGELAADIKRTFEAWIKGAFA